MYDFESLSGFIRKELEWEGITFPDGHSLTLINQLYLEAIWNFLKMVLIFTFVHSAAIYSMAFFGLQKELFKNGRFKAYLFIVSPYNFIHATRFHDIFQHFLEPLILITTFFLFRRQLIQLKKRLVEEHYNNPHEGSFYVVRIKDVPFSSEEKLKDAIDNLMGRQMQCEAIIVKDTLMLESNYKKYNQKYMELEEKKAKENIKEEQQLKMEAELRKIRAEVEKGISALKDENNNYLAQPYALISFESYLEAFEFYNAVNHINVEDLSEKGFKKQTRAFYAPEPHDIDWDRFGKRYKSKGKCSFLCMQFIFFLILPVVTFYIEYEFSLTIAQILLAVEPGKLSKIEGNKILEKTYTFLSIRVLLSSAYSAFCTFLIDFYYSRVHFKTYSAKEKSKLQFFNIYYLLNQIVADFYGIIRAGIVNLGKENGETILLKYNYYIFSAALKVGLALMFTPYLQKGIDFLPKIYYKLKVKLNFSSKVLNIDKIRADMPVKHDMGVMISMVLQGICFISFFSSFMMPILNYVILLGIFVFYYFEKWTLTHFHYNYRALNFNLIQKIYFLAFLGFMLTRVFSIGNANIIINYFNSINFENLVEFVARIFDYTLLVFLVIIGLCIAYRNRFSNFKHMILKELVDLSTQDKNGLIKEKFTDLKNFYNLRNPEEKVKVGAYIID